MRRAPARPTSRRPHSPPSKPRSAPSPPARPRGDLVEEAGRRREQVSVFISKKEGRIFIRQDWKDV